MLKKWAFVLLPLLVLGCAGSPGQIALMKPDKLETVSSHDICKAYSRRPMAKLRLILTQRGEFTSEEWRHIDERKIHVGMTELGLICAWGRPGLFGSVSESVKDQVTHRQWVYRPCPGCKAWYVYTENGKVTGWQNVETQG